MVKIENSKRTILNLAESLLQDKGFNGFSYANIASELGVKNAAIHYHFPSKEDLGVAVIKRYRERFKLWINNARVKDLSLKQNWTGSSESTATCGRTTARSASSVRWKRNSTRFPRDCRKKCRRFIRN
ncbi:MAG: TetR/AcrR family transcriptional regulator [Anaerolineales bacterium]|nr:TetR/AcrR family transcriptional regulator [Anaerolineales bacterium]